MEFEDGLIIGVALVIGLNRAFIGTGLKHSRAAYVFVQAFDVGAAFALFFARIFPDPRLDYAMRVFFMLFLAHGAELRHPRGAPATDFGRGARAGGGAQADRARDRAGARGGRAGAGRGYV